MYCHTLHRVKQNLSCTGSFIVVNMTLSISLFNLENLIQMDFIVGDLGVNEKFTQHFEKIRKKVMAKCR